MAVNGPVSACLVAFFLFVGSGAGKTNQDCYSGKGGDYVGSVSKTVSGKKCQSWSSQRPQLHREGTNAEEFPDGVAGLRNNYCRNPREVNERPWCYTQDRRIRWEYCDIPLCAFDGFQVSTLRQSYIGCFSDRPYHERDMPVLTEFGQENTVLKCVSYCRSLDLAFAGLQLGSQCWCGNDFGSNDRNKEPRPDAECAMKCTGNAAQICGSPWRNSVYATDLPYCLSTLQPGESLRPGEFMCSRSGQYIAIFQDDGDFVVFAKPSTSVVKTKLWSSETANKKGAGVVNRLSGDIAIFADDEATQSDSESHIITKDNARNIIWMADSELTEGGVLLLDNDGILRFLGQDRHLTWESTKIHISNYIGCFLDAEDRDLPEHTYLGDRATVPSCLAYCRSKGLPFAGLQAGADCFCGNDFGKHGALHEVECLVPCKGDGRELCGGLWHNAVYAVGLRSSPTAAQNQCHPQQGRHWLPYSRQCVAATEQPVSFDECSSLCSKQRMTFVVPEQAFFFEELTMRANWLGKLPEDYWINFACDNDIWVSKTSTGARKVPMSMWTPRRLRGESFNSTNTWDACYSAAGKNCGAAVYWEGSYHPLDVTCDAQRLRCLCAGTSEPVGDAPLLAVQQDFVDAEDNRKAASRPQSCESDWVRFHGGCYLKVPTKKTFINAAKYCVEKGAHLVKVDSKEENAFVLSLGPSAKWIGLIAERANEFHWSSTREAPAYVNWSRGEPGGKGNCAWMRTDGTWKSTKCDQPYIEFVCEKEDA